VFGAGEVAEGVVDDREAVGEHEVVGELPTLEEAGIADISHKMHLVHFQLISYAFFPVMQRVHFATGLVEAGEVAVHVYLVKGRDVG